MEGEPARVNAPSWLWGTFFGWGVLSIGSEVFRCIAHIDGHNNVFQLIIEIASAIFYLPAGLAYRLVGPLLGVDANHATGCPLTIGLMFAQMLVLYRIFRWFGSRSDE